MNTPTTIVSVSLAALVVAGATTGASGDTATHHRARWSEHSRVTADIDGDGRLELGLGPNLPPRRAEPGTSTGRTRHLDGPNPGTSTGRTGHLGGPNRALRRGTGRGVQ